MVVELPPCTAPGGYRWLHKRGQWACFGLCWNRQCTSKVPTGLMVGQPVFPFRPWHSQLLLPCSVSSTSQPAQIGWHSWHFPHRKDQRQRSSAPLSGGTKGQRGAAGFNDWRIIAQTLVYVCLLFQGGRTCLCMPRPCPSVKPLNQNDQPAVDQGTWCLQSLHSAGIQYFGVVTYSTYGVVQSQAGVEWYNTNTEQTNAMLARMPHR